MKSERLEIRINPTLKEKLQVIAKEENRTLSGLVLHIVQEYIKKEGVDDEIFARKTKNSN